MSHTSENYFSTLLNNPAIQEGQKYPGKEMARIQLIARTQLSPAAGKYLRVSPIAAWFITGLNLLILECTSHSALYSDSHAP